MLQLRSRGPARTKRLPVRRRSHLQLGTGVKMLDDNDLQDCYRIGDNLPLAESHLCCQNRLTRGPLIPLEIRQHSQEAPRAGWCDARTLSILLLQPRI